jgi:hypothetical protein
MVAEQQFSLALAGFRNLIFGMKIGHKDTYMLSVKIIHEPTITNIAVVWKDQDVGGWTILKWILER